MTSLIYISHATVAFGRMELSGLIDQSAAANAARGVTGLLTFNGEHFMQLLEGSKEAVDSIMVRIMADHRHSGLVVIRRDERDTRECPDWSMRYFLTPLEGAGAGTAFAARLPESFGEDTRVLFTSFASLPRARA